MNEGTEYIERYFSGELTPDEKRTFESRCLSDPGFANEVAVYILVQDQSRAQWIEHKKQEFTALDEGVVQAPVISLRDADGEVLTGPVIPPVSPEDPNVLPREQRTPRNISFWRNLAVAATIVGLIAIGTTFYMQNQKDKPPVAVNSKKDRGIKREQDSNTLIPQQRTFGDTTAQQDFKKPEVLEKGLDKVTRDQIVARHFSPDAIPKETTGVLDQAFNNYKSGRYKRASRAYEDAIAMVDDLNTRSAEDETEEKERKQLLFYAHYYNGISYLAGGNAEKAIAELKSIKKSPDSFWQTQVQWYLALATLKTGDVRSAEMLLKQVASNPHNKTQKTKAVNLLKEIEIY